MEDCMKAVLRSDTCGCRLIATPGFLTCAGEQPRPALGQSRHFARRPTTSGLPLETDIVRAGRHVSKVPTADIRDDVNEKERPPCGGLSKIVSRLHAVLAALTTLPWISERPVRRCGSRPAQPVAGRASGRDWSVTRQLRRPCALQRSAPVPAEWFDLQWPQCTNSASTAKRHRRPFG